MVMCFDQLKHGLCYVLLLSLFASGLTAQTSSVIIASGASAGTYGGPTSALSANWVSINGDLIRPDDGAGDASGCSITNDLSGKIAILDRTICPDGTRLLNAQTAGAIAAIVCFADDSPFVMLGDEDGAISIPAISMGASNCATILADMNSNTVNATINGAGDGEACASAIDIVDGDYTQSPIDAGFGGTTFQFGTHAAWYNYTAEEDGAVSISSCNGGADTRLIIIPASSCEDLGMQLSNNNFIASVDNCDDGNGGSSASSVIVNVEVGDQFKIIWDDAQSSDGFNFSINLTPLPKANVTIQVDMKNEVVDPTGVFVAGNFTDDLPTAMSDNGDETWSYTFEANTNDELSYNYYNGTTIEETNDLSDCATEGERTFQVLSSGDVMVPTVCFGLCTECIDVNTSELEFLEGIAIYPNPANDRFSLEYNFGASISLSINLINGLGQSLKTFKLEALQSGHQQLDVSDLAPGIYFLNIDSGTHQVVKRVVLQ